MEPSRQQASDARRATIAAMLHQGMSPKQISDALGTSNRAINNIISRMRAKGAELPSVRTLQAAGLMRDRILALVHQGLTNKQIAEEVGRAEQTVITAIARMRRLGVTIPPRPTGLKERSEASQKAANKTRKSTRARRKCLCGCNKMFWSSGPGNRIRPECNGDARYSLGAEWEGVEA